MSEKKPHLKILILEDNRFDVILIKELILSEKKDTEFYCTNNRKGYLEALDIFTPDIILSDNSFPQFTATEALGILRKRSGDIPFILVTGSMSDEMAAHLIEEGANGYVLKDNIAKLPITIESVLNKKRAAKAIIDYQYALNQTAIVTITNRQGIIIYANDNCCRISGYSEAELIANNHHILHGGFYQTDAWPVIESGVIWQGEFLNLSKNGSHYWVNTIIIPFNDENKKPFQYLAISNDISEKKILEQVLMQQQNNEQLKITAIALAAQEKDRNIIGQELHDNVNQLLVATKLQISLLIERTGGTNELLQLCNKNICQAIEENRKIAHILISPNLETDTLTQQLKKLTESMLAITGVKIRIETIFFDESLLSRPQKLALFHISQEQCSNIVKHASAKNVLITIQTSDDIFKMSIADDGQGINNVDDTTKGMGLKNMADHIGIFHGSVDTISSPGCGFTLEVEMPLHNF